jgi:hypothetical protein
MSRSDKHPVGRTVAKTEAKVDATLTNREAYPVKLVPGSLETTALNPPKTHPASPCIVAKSVI